VQLAAPLRVRPPARPAPAHGASSLVARPGQPPGRRAATRWFPDYIQMMPLDKHSNTVIAKHLLTSVFERQMDGLTRALVFGLGCCPRKGWRSLASWLHNHPGFDNAAEVKLALGAQFAQRLHAGHLEYVPDGGLFSSSPRAPFPPAAHTLLTA